MSSVGKHPRRGRVGRPAEGLSGTFRDRAVGVDRGNEADDLEDARVGTVSGQSLDSVQDSAASVLTWIRPPAAKTSRVEQVECNNEVIEFDRAIGGVYESMNGAGVAGNAVVERFVEPHCPALVSLIEPEALGFGDEPTDLVGVSQLEAKLRCIEKARGAWPGRRCQSGRSLHPSEGDARRPPIAGTSCGCFEITRGFVICSDGRCGAMPGPAVWICPQFLSECPVG